MMYWIKTCITLFVAGVILGRMFARVKIYVHDLRRDKKIHEQLVTTGHPRSRSAERLTDALRATEPSFWEEGPIDAQNPQEH